MFRNVSKLSVGVGVRGSYSFKKELGPSSVNHVIFRGAASQGLKHINEMPGPMAFPIIGSSLSMYMDKSFDSKKLHKYWIKAYDQYGDIFRLDAFGQSMVFIADPDDFQKVFDVTKENPLRPGLFSLKKIRVGSVDEYFEGKGGILLEDGEEWWRVRKRTQGPMMKPKIVRSYLKSHNDVSLEFVDIIAGFQEKHGEMPEDFQEEIYKWALESVALVALDRRIGCLEPGLSQDSMQLKLIKNANLMFEGMNDCEIGARLWRFYPTKEFKQLKDAHWVFVEMADKGIRQTVDDLKTKSPDDEGTLMESLLKSEGLSYKDVVTLVLDMLMAGIDTTAHTMGFALYLLAKNPEKQKKVQEEIDSIFGDSRDITPSQMNQLSYTRMVIKETLRMFPIGVGNMRKLTNDLEMKGYNVPAGHSVITLNLVASLQEKYFSKASEFIPERWARDRPLGPIHPFASLPFGAGTRMCIGRRIAEQEMYTFLIRVMQRYTVEYKYKDMEMRTKLVFVPSEPLKFNFIERK